MRTWVKICGITRLEDALAAARAGADALGFMFYPASPRHLTPEAAGRIIRQLSPAPPVNLVGVFVDPTPEFVQEAIRLAGITTLQFHGRESPEFCARFALPVWKAFRLQSESSLAQLRPYSPVTRAWLVDACVPGVLGGSGHLADWQLARVATRLGHPVFLAGGLTPDNVFAAVQQVQPHGVDVSSGVESQPGQKDAERISRFIRNVQAADLTLASPHP